MRRFPLSALKYNVSKLVFTVYVQLIIYIFNYFSALHTIGYNARLSHRVQTSLLFY